MGKLFYIILFTFTIALSPIAATAQTGPVFLTGDIYEFSVGDVFQFKYGTDWFMDPFWGLDNRHQITILSKDTVDGGQRVKYIRHHSCWRTVLQIPLDSIFWQYNDTVTYNLYDTLITGDMIYEFIWDSVQLDTIYEECDSSIYYDDCNTKIIEYQCNQGRHEPGTVRYNYGLGIGMTSKWITVGGDPASSEMQFMTYYKKGSIECGNKHWILTGIEDEFTSSDLKVYPNPVNEILNIIISDNSDPAKYELIDLSGKTLLVGELKSRTNRVMCSDIQKGTYFLRIISSAEIRTETLIKR